MTKTFTINKGQKPTLAQLKEVEEAKKYPFEFDEDCPELSPVMMKAFRYAAIERNHQKNT